MRPSVATVAALVAATIASLSHAPVVSAAPALRISDPDLGVVGGGRGVDTRLPYKLSKRDHPEEEDEVEALSEDEETEEAFDVPADLLEDADVEDSVSSKGVEEDEEEAEDVPKFATTSLDEATFNALAAGDYGASDSAAPAAGAPAAAAAAGPAAEAGSAPDSWDVALNMNPNDLPLLNNQAATTSKAGGNVQIGAPTDVNVDPNAATSTEQRQVGAPTDVNIDGTTRTTGAVQVGAPTDVNVDPNASTTTTTTKAGGNVQIGAPTDVNVDPNAGTTTTTTTTTMGAAPTQGGNNGGNNNIDNGEFECLEVLEDCNLQCKDVQSIDESQFNCSEDIDFGKDFMCTDAKGEEFDCTPLDGQTGAGSSGGSGDPNGSSSDPSYSGSQGADSNAAGLASSATSSWTSGILKTGVVTAFVLVASAAFLL